MWELEGIVWLILIFAQEYFISDIEQYAIEYAKGEVGKTKCRKKLQKKRREKYRLAGWKNT